MPEQMPMQFDNPCLGRIVFGQKAGDRLHLGHLLGSIKPIVDLQPHYEMIILIADGQPGTSEAVRLDSVYEVAAGWLSAGLSPNESLLARLSMIPEIDTLARLLAPFTIHGETIPVGLFHEACTLIAMQATHVPTHSSQRTAQHLAARIIRQFNSQTQSKLPEPAWMALPEEHLSGLDGEIMQSASGNAILLGESEETTSKRVIDLPDTYPNRQILQRLLDRLPDTARLQAGQPEITRNPKEHAAERINEALHSLRVKRMKWLASPGELEGVLQFGSQRARYAAAETLNVVQKALSRT